MDINSVFDSTSDEPLNKKAKQEESVEDSEEEDGG